MISRARWVWPRQASTARGSRAERLNVGITMLTRSSRVMPTRRRARAWTLKIAHGQRAPASAGHGHGLGEGERVMPAVVPGLVSTVIPVRNRPRMVREAITSVLAQTYRPLEVIVCDDGSTDDTAEAVEAAAGERPREVRVL